LLIPPGLINGDEEGIEQVSTAGGALRPSLVDEVAHGVCLLAGGHFLLEVEMPRA
jgi:hypothetical protein